MEEYFWQPGITAAGASGTFEGPERRRLELFSCRTVSKLHMAQAFMD